MLQKIIFLLLAMVIGLPLTSTAQDRNIVWVHGLNTNSNDWQNFRNQFSGSHRLNQTFASVPQTYNTSNGLQTFANAIDSQNQNAFGTATPRRSIVIGHSMGGAAARRLDFTMDVGGIITVGSPLNGAGIATAVNNGTATAEITNGVNQVSRGPISLFLPLVSILGIKVSDVINALVANGVLANNPLAFTPASIGQLSVNDLQLGGGIVADMNATPTPRPKISVFGNLSSPVHWKMATSAVSFSGTAPAILNGVNLAQAADQAEDVYHITYVVHTTLAVGFSVGGFFQPWLWFAAAYEFWVANEWVVGRDWLRDSERIWNVIIGANLPAVQSQCFTYNGFVCSYSNNANFMNPNCWQPVTTCSSIVLTGQSDGFIPAGSQTGLNSTSWAGAKPVEAFDVNHFQELDVTNSKMQQIFAAIWNGEHGSYFTTLPR